MSFPGKPHRSHISAPPVAIFGSNLVHWVRFDLQQCGLAGSKISRANDRIMHNDVVQTVDAQRPTFTPGGQNDRGYAAFSALANGGLATSTPFTGWNAGDGVYVWAVAKWNVLGSFVMTSNYTAPAGVYDSGATVRKNDFNQCQFFVNLGGGVGIRSVTTAPNSIGSTNTYYIEGWIDPGAGQIRCSINGGAPASTAVTNFGLASPIGRCALGRRADIASDIFDGRIYEVGASRVWSPAIQTSMRQYLSAYYSL